METLLVKYGYAVLFLGVMVEGEAFLLAAALLAHQGLLQLPVVIAVAVAANSFADQVYYLVARMRGRAWLDARYGGHPRYAYLVDLMARRGRWLLLGSRFLFGFRILIPAACGALGMPPAPFALLNLLAGVLWAVPVALLGYYGAGALVALAHDLKVYERWLAIGLLVMAAGLVAVRQLRRSAVVRELRLSDLHALVPVVAGLMGVLNLLSAILPFRVETILALERWLPLEVMQRSRALMLFAGIALLQVARSLARRKELAWYVSTVALSVSLLVHVGRGLDLHHSLVAALLLAYLLVFRRRFHARSDPASLWGALAAVPALAALVVTYGYVELSAIRDEFRWEPGATPLSEAIRSGLLVIEPQVDPLTERAARFLGSLQIAGWLARFYVLALLLRPVILRDRQEAPAGTVAELFEAHGRFSLSAVAIQPDKHHLLVAGGRGLVAYATRGGVALSCGDPLAAEEDLPLAAQDFVERCRANGWVPCFYQVAEARLPVYRSLGLRALKIAEEALVDLPTFSLAGGKRAALRSMVHKVTRAGLSVRRYDRRSGAEDAVDEQLEEISEAWLAEKRLNELSFSLSAFSLEALEGLPVFICESSGRVEAFCSWLPFRGGRAVVLDLMRRRTDAVSGTMDLLLARSLDALREAGLAEASLANAPLANVGEARRPLRRGVALLFEALNSFYGYKNLFQFKKKFAPRWESRFLVYPRGADLPAVALAMTQLHSAGGLWRILLPR